MKGVITDENNQRVKEISCLFKKLLFKASLKGVGNRSQDGR